MRFSVRLRRLWAISSMPLSKVVTLVYFTKPHTASFSRAPAAEKFVD